MVGKGRFLGEPAARTRLECDDSLPFEKGTEAGHKSRR